jgi:hypothetical protein
VELHLDIEDVIRRIVREELAALPSPEDGPLYSEQAAKFLNITRERTQSPVKSRRYRTTPGRTGSGGRSRLSAVALCANDERRVERCRGRSFLACKRVEPREPGGSRGPAGEVRG